MRSPRTGIRDPVFAQESVERIALSAKLRRKKKILRLDRLLPDVRVSLLPREAASRDTRNR